jgi:glycosyltransferase involved in cell wall biosynthesis
MKSVTLEISIPILNEEKVLELSIHTLFNYLSHHLPTPEVDWRIVVVDNGSTDQSPQIMQRLCSRFNQLQYLRIDRTGVGLALKTSWSRSKADLVGYMDVDLATSLEHIGEMLDILIKQHYDFVYGTRLHKNSRVSGRSIKREITSRVFNWLLRKYLQVGFSDGMCGFKFLKREVALSLIRNGAQSDGWFFSTELLFLAEKLDYKLYELPVEWKDSPDSKVRILKLAIMYLKAMHQIKKHVRTLAVQPISKNDTDRS